MSSHIARMRHLNRLWTLGFVPAIQEVMKTVDTKQNKQSIATTTIPASGWATAGGETHYSFETVYPFAQYDISVEPDGENITDAQMAAWLSAKPVGSATSNRIILKGAVPEIGIPIMVKVVKK